MPDNRIQTYTELSESTIRQISHDTDQWTGFLETASRMYKYSFSDQLLIHAQRPTATACAEYDLWNQRMGRYVRRGSKGIALLDYSGDVPAIRYVFDVSDTGARERSRPVSLWRIEPETDPVISSMLVDYYGAPEFAGLRDQLWTAAANLAQEYFDGHSAVVHDILAEIDGEEYNRDAGERWFLDSVTVSAAYALMNRCGLEPKEYMDEGDFTPLYEYLSPKTVPMLGEAVNQIDREVLREIEITLRNHERTQQRENEAALQERSLNHDRVQTERRLPDPGPQAEGDQTHREIRENEEEVSDGEPAVPVQPDGIIGDTVPAPSGDGRDDGAEDGGTDSEAGGDGGRDGEPEGVRSAEVGGTDEQLQSPGRRDSFGGGSVQLSLFPSEEEQIRNIDEAESRDNRPFAVFVPDAVINGFLRVGSNSDHARELTTAEFMKEKPMEDHASFLRRMYHGGYGLNTDGGKFAVWYAEEGLRFSQGTSAERRPDARILTWTEAAERIEGMLTAGTFASNVELEEALGTERRQIAEAVWFLRQDLSEDARDRYLPSITDTERYPADTGRDRIADRIGDPDFRSRFEEDLRAFITDYAENRDLLRFRYHRPDELLARMEELDLPIRSFSSALSELPPVSAFITEDEIERTLGAGGSYEGSRGRIAAYFAEEHTSREKIAFLKKEYGEGGRSHALSMSRGSMEDYDSRGIRLRKQDCVDVELSWANVVKRIDRLIGQGRFAVPPETEQNRNGRTSEAEEPAEPENDAETGVTTPVSEPKNTPEPDWISGYNSLKERYPEELVLYQVGDFYELFGEDARRAAEILDLELTMREIPGAGQVDMCAFPAFQLNDRLETIRDTYDAAVSSIGRNGEREVRRLLSFDHEADQALNEHEAEYGADGWRAFPGNNPDREMIRDSIDEALLAWNHDYESKTRMLAYMSVNGREEEAAQWLASEYGGNPELPLHFTIQGTDIDVVWDWPRVQRRLIELIDEGRFDEVKGRVGVYLGESDNIRYYVVPGSFGFSTHFPNQTLLGDNERAVVASPVCYFEPEFLVRNRVTFLKIGRDIAEDQISGKTAAEQFAAMQEAMVFRTPEGHTYQIGDGINVKTANRQGSQFTIENVDSGHIYYDFTNPEFDGPVGMNRERFEEGLDSGLFTVVRGEHAQEQDREPDAEVIKPDLSQPRPGVHIPAEHDIAPEYTADNLFSDVSVYSGDDNRTDFERENGLHSIVIDLTGRGREPVAESSPDLPPENFIITDEHLGEGGPKAKFRANMDAIHTLKAIEAESRTATPEEQETLSRYVGWGGIPEAFDPEKSEWTDEYAELKAALTPEEYEAARGSTLNAHYTTPTVISAIYEAVERMGFTSGNILEPSMGVGNFFGMLPESMRESKLYGVELDSITGRIAKNLYPNADITVAGFETTDRRDFYDLAVGNVPFGNYKVNDPAYNKLNFSIHNYFFAKAIDQVRPGGVIAFVTSRYTMDAQGEEVRRYIAERADLLGAIRLPETAFLANANTEVVTDILFLQKRESPVVTMPDWVGLGKNEQGYAVNRYFLDHPEMILGIQSEDSTRYGMDYTVKPREDVSLKDLLHDAVQNIRGTYKEAELPDLGEGEVIRETIPADPDVKNFSYTIVDGKLFYRENSVMVRPDLNATAEARVKGMVELRDCVRNLLQEQMDGMPDESIRRSQDELNRLYDSYTERYGLINDRANRLAFSDDSSYYLLCSLEILNEDRQLERKAEMFTQRTIRPPKAVDHVDTAAEALAVSISERARVDMAYMSALSGKTEEELEEDLRGAIFRIPENPDHFVTADEYLSGNVRQKLVEAQSAAESNSALAYNVEALQAAQPKDLDASEIEVRLGATWIEPETIKQFMFELLQTGYYARHKIDVEYSKITGEWKITNKSNDSYNVSANVTYGTVRASAYKILEDTLNLRDVRIFDVVKDINGVERRVLNSRETTLAQQKQQIIKDKFREWIWENPDRRHYYVRKYNDLFNSDRPREYNGEHLTLGGMNPEITLREHQRNAIAHILYGGNTLLAHEVGAGKTFEMAAAAMEAKRLGLCTKPLFVVPNHLTEQWASEFLRLYPSANILVATKKDFEPANRKRFCARIATGNYDAIIMGHSQFEKIPMSRERQEELLRRQIAEIEDGIEDLKMSRGERSSVKDLERTKKSLQAKLEKLLSKPRDDVVTFEQLGVDRLFVDEAHNYKNLFLYTKMRNVAGLSTTDAQKSSDMYLKCRYLDEVTGGKGTIFATGTPVSNSMTELYTMMRYLQHDLLDRKNLSHFDAWASTFGETQTAIELAPEGTGYRARTRFAKFFNLPELMNLFKEAADIKTSDQLHLPVPEAVYHNVVAQPTDIQIEMVKQLSDRASDVHNRRVDPSVDNMLKITTDGRKLGLDQRIINPDLPDDPTSKVNLCVDNIARIWEEGKSDKLTQLVFCDLSTPKAKASASKRSTKIDDPEVHAAETAADRIAEAEESTFSVYEDIRDKLIARGVPSDEIAFIHDADTEVKKKELFAKVRNGTVRVLIGSTSKMGAGTNCQDRLIAMHDLDCPWRPGDLEQRKGRIVRQGNQNQQVHIFRYVTEGTFDAYLWQTVENKQKFISQIMSSKSPVRSCDDIDEATLSYAEVKALCAGDPRIKEKMDLDIEVARLKVLEGNHRSSQYRLQDDVNLHFPNKIASTEKMISGFEKDMETVAAHPHPKDGFAGMMVKGDALVDKDNAGAALLEAKKDATGLEPVVIGTYRGFEMSVTLEDFGKKNMLTLRGEMSHRVELGSDARGNLIRIDNVLNGIPDRITTAQKSLEDTRAQHETAKAELGKPFPQAEELAAKSARLTELNAELNIDSRSAIESGAEAEPDEVAKARPSILERLQELKAQIKDQDAMPKKRNQQVL